MTEQEITEYRSRAVSLTLEWYKTRDGGYSESTSQEMLSVANDIAQFIISGTIPEKVEDE